MRGILECWIKQAARIELFKKNQCSAHALHVKFHLTTGDQVYTDEEYNHLQIDVASIYLLFLVQMITSGLQIIYTQACFLCLPENLNNIKLPFATKPAILCYLTHSNAQKL